MSEVIAVTCGIIVLAGVWLSALRTVLIPRRTSSRMARWNTRACAELALAVASRLPYRAREWVLEFAAPAAMCLMASEWLIGLALGFAILGVGVGGVALDSHALTHFFAFDSSGTASVISVFAVVSALLILSLFAAYLVQFTAAYHRRERMISRSASLVREVTDAERLVAEHLRAGSRDSLDLLFARWADWLGDIHETHVSYPGLLYQRRVGRICWAKAAMIVLDAAALVEAVAPAWAPVHTMDLLDVGSACLRDLATRIGIDLPVMTISLHGREERPFSDTVGVVTDSGLRAEREINHASVVFQRTRARYAPYAVFIGSRLLSPFNGLEMT